MAFLFEIVDIFLPHRSAERMVRHATVVVSPESQADDRTPPDCLFVIFGKHGAFAFGRQYCLK